MRGQSRKLWAIAISLALGSAAASAQAQLSATEQTCIGGFTTSVARVGKVQGGIVKDCLKRFAGGSLINTTPEACMLAGNDSGLSKAKVKTEAAAYFACSTVTPSFGVIEPSRAVIMAGGKDIELLRRVIGPDIDTALVATTTGARCQVRVAAAMQKCADTRMAEYTKCLRKGMAAGTIVDAVSAQAVCLDGPGNTQPDPDGRIAAQCDEKLLKAIVKNCENVDLGRAFSPCSPTDARSLVSCVARESGCKLCQVLNSVNDLSQDCDSFDDGDDTNGTCDDECADGIVQRGERCDDGNTTSEDGCDEKCKLEAGWTCIGEPSVCTPNCGNGVVDVDDGSDCEEGEHGSECAPRHFEECDDGNTEDGDGCSSTCVHEECGDGDIDLGETCDDDNHSPNDGCSKTCQTEPGYLCTGEPSECTFVCGNGTFEAGETCDDGNTTDRDGCSGVCTVENGFICSGLPSVCSGVCGDGLVRTGEGCDDGNLENGDGCANSCQEETGYRCLGEPSVCSGICGDGRVRKSETCDDGDTDSGDGCSSSCQTEPSFACSGQPSVCGLACGNGRLDGNEQCDDGPGSAADGCVACTIQAGYACAGQPSVCAPTCSNGSLEVGEQCDDHNTQPGDGCSPGCRVESGFACLGMPSLCSRTCGNGILQASLGETCDDGDRDSGDGCSSTCKVEIAYSCSGSPSICSVTCGNGRIDANVFEQCDDGGTVSGDGCSDACFSEPGWYCEGAPSECEQFEVFIDSPSHGSFSDAASVMITGHYTALPANRVSLLINGVAPNVSWNPQDRTFVHSLTLDQDTILNPVGVTLADTATEDDVRARIVILAGRSVADGEYSPESVAMRLNESGLASMQSLISSLASSGLNIGSLIPVGSPLIDQCVIDVGFLGCWGSARVAIDNPAPSFSGVGLATDSKPGAVRGDISVNGLRLDIRLSGSGLVPSCGIRMSANRLALGGDYALEPAMANPSHVDVDLVGPMATGFNGFNVRFTWGICSWPIISDILGLFTPLVEDLAVDAMQGFLKDPDGTGPQKSPVAEGIESALDGVNISGSVGQGVGLSFEAPMFKIEEDHVGITLGAHSRFNVSVGTGLGQCTPPPGTPDFARSFSPYQAFPAFGATSPVRGVPYGLGIAISPSGFNQLLRGQTECGLMRTSLSEIDLDGPEGAPASTITSDLLMAFVPEFAFLPPGTPLRIDLAPTIAPFVSGDLGPNGEVAELMIAQLGIKIVDPTTNDVWLTGAFDAKLGIDLAFAPDGSGLSISINKPAISDVTIRVIDNPLGANEESVETVLPNIMAPMIPSLAGALSGFPLPQFFGLQLQGVEVSRNGQFIGLFANLVAGS